ncbi:IS1634 family transposase, partial [Mycoplasma phocimorsus]|nr:transposase [Mycoplasma phocimorsus]
MSKFNILNCTNAQGKYTFVIQRNKGKNGYKKIVSLGNYEKLEKQNKDYLVVLRNLIKNVNWTNDPQEIKEYLLSNFLKSGLVKTVWVNDGVKVIYKVIKKLGIYNLLPKTKHKDLEALLEYQIASKILSENSILKRFEQKDEYQNNIECQKTTFYNFLDILADNQDAIFKGINNKITQETDRNIELIFYDSSTVYFESFVREGLRVPGYSKDGKFKEDQVVIGMATDENGIPIMLKVFRGNTADCNT